jgi:hypothetical protein
MAYIGRGLDRGNYLKLDDISSQFDGIKTTFNLTTGGQPFFPGSAFSLLVSISGVIQEPETAYQINSSELVFTGPPGLGEPFFAVAMSQPINIQTPSDGTITSAKIAAGAVTTAKIADGAVTPFKLSADAKGVGIQSGGVSIAGAGVTQLNFIGLGNTFAYNATTKTVDINIVGGGGGGAIGGITTAAGIGTEVLIGINTDPVGSGSSEGILQTHGSIAITEGALLTDQNINTNLFIPSGKNGLVIGAVTVGVGITIDIAPGSTLVVV